MKNRVAIVMAYCILFICNIILAKEMPKVTLPNDEGAHDYNLEWWYYTGHLEALDSHGPKKFAFEITVFKGEVFKPLIGYVAHFAFIDLDEKKHFPFQRINIFASILPPAPTHQGFKFVFDGARWVIEGKNGRDKLKALTSTYSIDLQLESQKPAALFGDEGIVDYASAGEMAYYSRTRMRTHGNVTIPDKQGGLKTYYVTGSTWMDHQWGNSGNPAQMGWDWFSVQLQNNVDLMMFRVRNRTTQEILKTSGFIVSPLGEVSSIPEQLINIEALNIFNFDKVSYPTKWHIKVPAPYDMDFEITARFADQRFKVPLQVTPIYWEGSCSAEGIFWGEELQGQGFTEMAGYE